MYIIRSGRTVSPQALESSELAPKVISTCGTGNSVREFPTTHRTPRGPYKGWAPVKTGSEWMRLNPSWSVMYSDQLTLRSSNPSLCETFLSRFSRHLSHIPRHIPSAVPRTKCNLFNFGTHFTKSHIPHLKFLKLDISSQASLIFQISHLSITHVVQQLSNNSDSADSNSANEDVHGLARWSWWM
jgi:hypothetical protein